MSMNKYSGQQGPNQSFCFGLAGPEYYVLDVIASYSLPHFCLICQYVLIRLFHLRYCPYKELEAPLCYLGSGSNYRKLTLLYLTRLTHG